MTSSELIENTVTNPAATMYPLGQDGILVRFGDGYTANTKQALNFGDVVRQGKLDGVVDVATSLTSVLVQFAPQSVSRGALLEKLDALLADQKSEKPSLAAQRLWTIPVSFDGDRGPQLQEAAALAGLSPRQAIEEITGQDLSVLAIGFAPGQPYIGHLPDNWNMPRQSEITAQVPAGALVVALRQLVLFANQSPTGWRWIGTCAFAPFQADRATPFALQANDLIRFVAVDDDTITTLKATQSDGLGGAVCKVLT
ncbi:5-oxoprolinase subunit B family protein [Yoonia sp. MH D7]